METIGQREKEIYQITIWGGIVNLLLTAFKFVAGIVGHSGAMIADAVHSLSDLLTDFIVLIFVRISGKPADKDHHYGHGKYETLATAIIGICLLVVGALLMKEGIEKIVIVIHGGSIASPGWIAFVAAVVSILSKEIIFQLTARVARKTQSDAVLANAWHHRSDALSSVGTGLGIAGALLLGEKWVILDPIAAVIVSIFIIITAIKLIQNPISQLLDRSLPEKDETCIRNIIAKDEQLSCLHNLRTRKIGNRVSIDMHLRMPGNISLHEAHEHSIRLEKDLRQEFGSDTIINIHIEPLKVNGQYDCQEELH